MVNSFGTIIFTFIFGKLVGKDLNNNKYYVSKKNKKKKWVIYSASVDPTSVSSSWQLWLTNETLQLPKNNKKIHYWQKNRVINKTGTSKAYYPEGSIKNKKPKYSKLYNAWEPPK